MSTFSMNGSPTCTEGSFLRDPSASKVSDASTDTPPIPSSPVRAKQDDLVAGAGGERQMQVLLP